MLAPWGLEEDLFGVGASWAQPADDDLRDQTALELFYRAQLSRRVQLTPGVQLIFNSALNDDSDPVGVFTLRFRAEF